MSLNQWDLRHLLVDHGTSRRETDGLSTKFLFDLYRQKSSRSRKQTTNWNYQNRVKTPQWIPKLEPVYRPWMKGRMNPLEEGPCHKAKNSSCLPFSQPSPSGPTNRMTVHLEKEIDFSRIIGYWLWTDIINPRNPKCHCDSYVRVQDCGSQVSVEV